MHQRPKNQIVCSSTLQVVCRCSTKSWNNVQLSCEQRQFCYNSIFNCNNSAIKKIFNKIIVIMEQLIFTLKFLWKGNDGLPLFSRGSVLRISVCRSHFYSSSTVENKKRSKKRPKFRKNISETFLVVSSAI